MRIGIVILPEHDWKHDRERWVRAEDYGFDNAWTYDHLAWRSLADGPWHATVPTLTAAALSTERIGLGTLVTTPNYRHPVPLAKDLMTLDVMSEGRLHVAIGAGAPGYDADVLGEPALSPLQRYERFVEFRTLIGELLGNRIINWSGAWYEAQGARMIPGPVQQPRPPLIIAAEGPRTMRLAAITACRPGDGWVTLGVPGGVGIPDAEWWAKVEASAAAMDKTISEVGGTAPGFVRLLNMESRISTITSADQLADHVGRAAEFGFTDVAIAWPRRTDPFRGDERLLEAIAADLPTLRRA